MNQIRTAWSCFTIKASVMRFAVPTLYRYGFWAS